MNTPLDHEPGQDLRYAEYVLGVLDADARAAVEREIETDAQATLEIARWQRYLLPWAEDIGSATPPDVVWARIASELGFDKPSPATSRVNWWNHLELWRGLAFSAAAVAVAFIIVYFVVARSPVATAPTPSIGYMASAITRDNGQVGWTATMDVQHARMVVVPVRPQTLPSGRAAELWLIPAGRKPIPVGMIQSNAPTVLALDAALIARLGPTAALAVSVEPPGGSPTGQPTGPVIAKGSIGAAAPPSTGKPVAMLRTRVSQDFV